MVQEEENGNVESNPNKRGGRKNPFFWHNRGKKKVVKK